MKRFLVTIVLVLSLLRSYADEGMWLPMLLGQQVYAEMQKKGIKLTPEQLYSINKASLKDAIIIFGGGCTGEIVSDKGLIFTNHHCGYGAIAAASSVNNNYLRDGFYAKTLNDEIKTSLSVQFLVRVEDVTKEVLDSLGTLLGAARAQKQNQVLAAINARFSNPAASLEARVSPLFKGNQFLVFVYQRYKDVRLVGTPPESVGKFGGDTDNWEWPRHTGDFAIFRVYATADGQPADYSEKNVPLKPKWFLPVSMKGVKDGDFSMIWGYPGSTNRYETSLGVKMATDINNPTLVELRDMRLKYMIAEMQKSAATKLKLASSFASIANYWKFYDGETKQLLKYDVFGQKKAAEAKFISWASDKPAYAAVFPEWEKAYAAWEPYTKHRVYMNEGIYGSPLLAFASSLLQLESVLVKTNATAADVKKAMDAASASRQNFLEGHDAPSDRNILGMALLMYYRNVAKEQHPIGFFENVKGSYGDPREEATWKKFAADVFSKTMILDDSKWNLFVQNPNAVQLQEDPAFAVASAFTKNWNSKFLQRFQEFTIKNNDLGRLYLKGIMEMNPAAAKKMYPDATFTMRVSYGNVKNYIPRDAVRYDFVTTSRGLLEKYKPGDYEFDLPEKQIELLKKKDFGPYADPIRKDLVIGFITTNDITGGNSGSPVLDANGHLIGLAFDGNYEALSHKIAFDKDLNRTICVDIRYVLWCIDKLGGAGHLIKELKLVRQ
ncbi:MAG TPA: S46 family peptidase [Lacibacter sp.]|nr:S46 family peptidase [Lacibacter sp.]HMO88530.1 S46 family peptidase [Lacibacter sp.]HMP86203.1 S46 family peptidase [Lacibacter sp.]